LALVFAGPYFLTIPAHDAAKKSAGNRKPMAFFLFWVAVAAALLNAVPALAGTLLGAIGGFGKIKIAVALAGPSIVALGVTSYLRDPYAQFSDHVYNVAVLFFSMFAWSLFSGGVTVTVRELLPNTIQLDLLKRRLGLD